MLLPSAGLGICWACPPDSPGMRPQLAAKDLSSQDALSQWLRQLGWGEEEWLVGLSLLQSDDLCLSGTRDLWGFPDGSADKEPTCQCRRLGFDPWVGKIPCRRKMATHSSIPAWRIPWTEEPGRLQPEGLKRIRHD